MSCLEVCVPEERHAAVTEMLRNVVEEESCVEAEEPLQCRDGQRRWILWNIRRFEDYAEETVLLATGTDVTGRRLAEERLLQAERLAAIGNAMTGLAHESRNALQRAQANLELLALFLEDQPEAREIVTRLQATQSDLYRLYEEVRQYAAPLSLRPERISLQAVIQEAWDLLSAERQHRDAVLDCVLPMPGLECSGDRFQLLRVFRNLLENALAASPDPVHILASIEAVDQLGKPAVRVSIRDNGPGIPLDKQRRVFDEFFTTRQRGTGLGLAIVKRIIDAHGGDVRVNPDYHDGAEFQITLPIQSSPEAARELADDLY